MEGLERLQKHALECHRILDDYYPEEIVFLEFENCFQTVISVALSAQTTDRQVNEIMGPLFSKYPDAAALAQASRSDVEQIIRPCGFYKVKANHIIEASKKMVAHFGGKVPSTMKELLSLNGIGRKSANVVLGHCYNQPAIIVDTHFGRVVHRLGLTESKNPDRIEKDIAAILEPEHQYRFSMTANNHGRVFCHSRKPDCKGCFLKAQCRYYCENID